MKYIVYKITNNTNGKIYIGVHKTKDINDGYMGSGKYIKHAIGKYGIDNFTKDILQVFDNSDQMYELERELVTEDFIRRNDTYNIKEGGHGGFDYVNSSGFNRYCRKNNPRVLSSLKKASDAFHKKLREDNEFKQQYSKTISDIKKKEYSNKPGTFFGKTHSDEAKRKIGMLSSISQSGEKNSQYGTMWIHNAELNKNIKIQKNSPIPEGWVKGRKLK
jgi:hypothetical protein